MKYNKYQMSDYVKNPKTLLLVKDKLEKQGQLGLAEEAIWLYNQIMDFKERTNERAIYFRSLLIAKGL